MPKNKITKCLCLPTKKGQKNKNAPLCAYCQQLALAKIQPVAKSVAEKKPLLKTRVFWKYLLFTTSFLAGSTGAYFWSKEIFFPRAEIPKPEISAKEEREIPSPENSEKETAEPENLAADQNIQTYFTQIITRIQNGTITDPEAVVLKTPEQRETGIDGYLTCRVTNCLLNVSKKKCLHGNYFACPTETCPFWEAKNYQFHDYCNNHTCKAHDCQQLVVIYQDGSREKYCRKCLPNPSNF